MISGATVYLDIQYLPCLEYFVCMRQAGKVILEKQENFQKQSYRNRCYILTPEGKFPLSIPVKEGNRNKPVSEVQMDFRQKWVKDHWRAIVSAYGKAPFFEHYAHAFEPVYENPPVSLWEMNEQLLTICLKLLQWDIPWQVSSVYEKNIAENNALDLRAAIHPKKSWQTNGIYERCEYTQVFGSKFVENLSIIDLLFNEGPNAGPLLLSSYAGS
ncbi:WbqC family protein [Roseivirga sp. BDSF3-8]|uniref:WbqC family protein n=1 Tax=Roseivirga sp. BDSF3-8 TaxID=3241598 RepID=UPI0035320AF0